MILWTNLETETKFQTNIRKTEVLIIEKVFRAVFASTFDSLLSRVPDHTRTCPSCSLKRFETALTKQCEQGAHGTLHKYQERRVIKSGARNLCA